MQTRLRKLDAGEYSATILAAAGLKRLGLAERISRYFSTEEMIPAAGQGVLALQGRSEMDYHFLDGFFDITAGITSVCERAFVRGLDGGCSSPIAAFAEVSGNELKLTGLYYDEDTKRHCIGSDIGDIEHPKELGIILAQRLRQEALGKGGSH